MTDEFDAEAPELWAIAYRVAFRVLGERSAAEDAAQDTLARAAVHWRSIGSTTREGWVARTATNLAIDEARRRNRRRRTARPGQAHGSFETVVEEREALRRLLGSLPRRQREVIALRFLADLTEAETAATLGISVGSVKQHAHRALAVLRPQVT